MEEKILEFVNLAVDLRDRNITGVIESKLDVATTIKADIHVDHDIDLELLDSKTRTIIGLPATMRLEHSASIIVRLLSTYYNVHNY